MIVIHATKKLLAKLPVDDEGLLPLSPRNQQLAETPDTAASPLSGWHANLLTIQRRNCVLLVHDATRFPVFIPGLTKPDLAKLDWWFEDALMNTLLKCDASQPQLDKAAAALARLKFDTHCARSVQGTMNQMAQDAEYSLHYDGVNVAEITGHRFAAWLADRPYTVKGRRDVIWPVKAFLELLEALPDSSKSTGCKPEVTRPDNVVNLSNFYKNKS